LEELLKPRLACGRIAEDPQEAGASPSRTAEDGPLVRCCFAVDRSPVKGLTELWLDASALLEEDYDVLLVENLELLPMGRLAQVWDRVRAKATTVLVIHEGFPPAYPDFYRLEFDAVVCFDGRYRDRFARRFPWERLHVIPFPAHPWRPGDRPEARRRLGFAKDYKIVLSTGTAHSQHLLTLPVLEALAARLPLLYIVLEPPPVNPLLQAAQMCHPFLRVVPESLSVDGLFGYLHAADALLLYKQSPLLVISSTVHLTLGSGCPIVVAQSRYTEDLGEEVLRFRELDQLEACLEAVFSGHQPPCEAQQRFLAERGSGRVAAAFLELFEQVGRG
jgi:hypothetical protein